MPAFGLVEASRIRPATFLHGDGWLRSVRDPYERSNSMTGPDSLVERLKDGVAPGSDHRKNPYSNTPIQKIWE